jgi:pyruvate kinase
MKRRTKIVCTLGPAVDTEDGVAGLIENGMNVARLNCSHGDWETRRKWIKWIRDRSQAIGPIAILTDLQGPKFRLGELPPNGLEIKPGQALTVGPGNADIPIHQTEIVEAFEKGARLLLGDGDVELKLGDPIEDCFQAKAISGGLVRSRQGVTLVGKVFRTSPITEKDYEDIKEACRAGVDYIALSYVHTAEELQELRREIAQYDPTIRICAKIETRDALKNIDSIIQASDIIMVARGDMGLQMDIEDVPLAQKRIISRCRAAGKPVITATQMLESMVRAPRPTRAEAADVANAILDGTDAVMLSGETAAGQYPMEALRYMARIAEKAESIFDYGAILQEFCAVPGGSVSHTEAVAHSVAQLSALTSPKAILTTTTSGQTARLVSKFRPKTRILCATWDHRVQAQLAVVWGVEAIFMPLPATTDEQIENAIDVFVRHKRLKVGDHVIVSAGVPAGKAGNTNLIMTQVVKG